MRKSLSTCIAAAVVSGSFLLVTAAQAAGPLTDFKTALATAQKTGKRVFVYVHDSV